MRAQYPPTSPTEARKVINADSEEVVERVAKCELELSKYKEREGNFSKKSVLLNAKEMEPAAWWT